MNDRSSRDRTAVSRSSSVAAPAARRFRTRAFALVFVCATLVFAIAPAIPVDAADTRPYIGEYYGVTREKLIKWLQSHEHDNYYLGTPYGKLAYTAPNGDPYAAVNPIYPTGGEPRMNCAGFVAHAVYKCGLDVVKWCNYLGEHYPALYYRQSYNIASADMWYLHVTGDSTGFNGAKELTGAFRYYSFPSVTAAVASGRMQKGDLFIFWPTEGFAKDRTYTDSHIGVYWGDYSGENKFWHMHWPYCEIGPIYSFLGPYNFIVIPLSPGNGEKSGTLTVTEQRAEDGKAMIAARFSIKNDATGETYTLGPTGPDGKASISIPEGVYTVRQTAYPAGYTAAGSDKWQVRIVAGKTTELKVKCTPPSGTLEITQTDPGSKGLAGGEFTATAANGGATVRIKATDASGKTSASLAPGTYTVTQTKFPADYSAKGSGTWTVKIESSKTTKLTAPVVPNGTLGITLTDAGGNALSGATFTATPSNGREAVRVKATDASGKASASLAPGTYTVTIASLPSHYTGSGDDSWTVKIESGKSATITARAALEKGAIGVTVVDSEGEGVGGVCYSVRDTDDLSVQPIAEIQTDIDGVAVYGIEDGEYTLDHGTVLYLHYERSIWDCYIPDATTYRVTVRGLETVAAGGGEITFAARSAITLAADIPEGEYAVFTDEECEESATVPNAELTAQVDAVISGGEVLGIAAGTYWLRLNEDISRVHDGTTVTYTVEAKANQTSTVEAASAVTRDFVHHFIDGEGETAVNDNGFVTHACSGCGEQILFGDVNVDGMLNARDVVAMMRAQAGLAKVDESRRDMNGDFKFNARDVVALMRIVMAA